MTAWTVESIESPARRQQAQAGAGRDDVGGTSPKAASPLISRLEVQKILEFLSSSNPVPSCHVLLLRFFRHPLSSQEAVHFSICPIRFEKVLSDLNLNNF